MYIDDQSLANALLQQKMLTDKALANLQENAKIKQLPLQQLLFEREVIPDEKLGMLIAQLYGVPFVKLSDRNIPENLLRIIPYTLASHQSAMVFDKKADSIDLAISDPRNYELINSLEKKTGMNINVHYATRKDIKNSLKAYNKDVNTKFTQLLKRVMKDPTKIESLKDAAKILDTIVLFAFQSSASDIHIEPHKDFIGIRFRIDGLLQTIAELPIQVLDLLTTRIKVLANLRTDEHRAAQDGRFKIDLEGNEITLRVSILPTYDGEKTVMRLLTSSNQELNIESLGYSEHNLKLIRRNIVKSNGLILTTGPTGSGKTTTMYSVLKILNSPEINISTIEDPIEYKLEGVNQTQVNAKTDLTFANGLRSLLRQDPDIIMVGEIRDEETGSIAINAALTGHLVFATLHTNDAVSTLTRMVDMGIEAFLVGSTARIVIAQRLVRTICDKCKVAYNLDLAELDTLGQKFNLTDIDLKAIFSQLSNSQTLTFYKGQGCQNCGGSGYKGRISVSEVMEVTEGIKKMIFQNKPIDEVEKLAKDEGMIPLIVDGMQKVLNGQTTIEEILRVMRT